MTAETLSWEAPPKRKGGGGRGRTPDAEEVQTAKALLERAGEWAQIKVFDGEKGSVRAAALANQIKSGSRSAFAFVLEEDAAGEGGFDATSRALGGDEGSAVYARYVEDPADVQYKPRA